VVVGEKSLQLMSQLQEVAGSEVLHMEDVESMYD